MMVPVGRLVLLRSVPKSELVTALAYLTVPALIGPMVGPPLGGFITTYFRLALDLLDQPADRHPRHRAGARASSRTCARTARRRSISPGFAAAARSGWRR